MNLFKIIFLPFLICGHFAMAQDISVDKEIKKIDSLIQYNQFDSAEEKINSLQQQFNNSNQRKKYKDQILEVRFRRAVLLDRKNGSSVEPLQLLLGMINEVEAEHLYSLSCRVYLMIALAYEKTENLELTNEYLNKAYTTYKNNHLEEIYSTYCIRRSSYYRFVKEQDSSFYYANKAKEYAAKYNNEKDLTDSYLLLGTFLFRNKKYVKALEYRFLLVNYYLKTNDTVGFVMSYNNIATIYLKMKDHHKALLYSDSAYFFYNELPLIGKKYLPESRSQIFEGLGNIDSAYYYFRQYHNDQQLLSSEEEKLNTKKLEEQYQSDKKEATIKNKNQQMILIISLLIIIVIAVILLATKNRQINLQNKIISQQLEELMKALEQKQMLLSELQHRVKNNLQHVISILEIQKESVDFNNIEELIRGNQNRIHSMALLHKKLNVSDAANEVDLKRYIADLSELVKDSYDSSSKKISLGLNCEIETMSIEKALPIGLIIVELVSNSMKHAFKKRNIGIISIEIKKDEKTQRNKLYYTDNGNGFDFNKTIEKGLGMEIIRGLIDQLNGTVEANNRNGFELMIYF